MFGLSWGQIGIIVLVGAFVLGPERIPTAVSFVNTAVQKVRTMAAGAQAGLRSEVGPELDELRRQIADLQSLKEVQQLRDLRDLTPRRIGKNIFLGLDSRPAAAGPGSTASLAKPAAVSLTKHPPVVLAGPSQPEDQLPGPG
jgi:sec-independent protein translocase protein TatB